MTREEKQKAIDALKISAPRIVMTHKEFIDYKQTLDKIRELLEQEPVLDKIRVFIDKPVIRDEYSQRQNDYCDGYEFVCNQIREIIDTNKAESEE